jgi:hypothetical protein
MSTVTRIDTMSGFECELAHCMGVTERGPRNARCVGNCGLVDCGLNYGLNYGLVNCGLNYGSLNYGLVKCGLNYRLSE